MNFKDTSISIWTYIRKNVQTIILLAILAIAFFFLFKHAVRQVEQVAQKSDTTITHITQLIRYIPQYVPALVIHDTLKERTITISKEYEAPTDNKELLAKYEEIVKKLLTENTYKDSIKLKDSVGNNIGIVKIEDKISENEIKSRKTAYQLSLPRETITITKTITSPAKRHILVGVEGSYSKLNPFNFVGGGIIYQDRKNTLIKLTSGFQFSNSSSYISFGLFKPF